MAITYDAPSNTITVTGYSEVTPATMADVYAADVAGGWGVVTEVVADGMYFIQANLQVGDNINATYFILQANEVMRLADDVILTVLDYAHLQVGALENDRGKNGGVLILGAMSVATVTNLLSGAHASLRLYGSFFAAGVNHRLVVRLGAFEMIDSTWKQAWTGSGTSDLYLNTLQECTIYGSIFTNLSVGIVLQSNIFNFEKSAILKSGSAFGISQNGATRTAYNLDAENCPLLVNCGTLNSSVTLIDPIVQVTQSQVNTGVSGYVYLKYTVDVNVADRNGEALSGVTVGWADSRGNGGSDVTDANGNVDFTLLSKQWVGISEDETDFNDFIFTISKSGYETLTLENITIDSPIDWHLELQDKIVYPIASDVESGTTFGPSGVSVGTLIQPAIYNVKSGATYGGDGSEFTGIYAQTNWPLSIAINSGVTNIVCTTSSPNINVVKSS